MSNRKERRETTLIMSQVSSEVLGSAMGWVGSVRKEKGGTLLSFSKS